MTEIIAFNNQLEWGGTEIIINLTLKKKSGISIDAPYVKCDINKIDLHTHSLINSIVFNVSKLETTFKIKLCDLDTLKRLELKNEMLEFEIQTDTDDVISFSIYILNLITLHNAGLRQDTKTQCSYLVDIDFEIECKDEQFLMNLMEFLTKMDGTITVEDTNELNSISSEISSISLNSSVHNSAVSLSSVSSNAKQKLTQYLHKGRFFKDKKQETLKLGSSTSPSALTSPETSDVDLTSPLSEHDDTDGFLILEIESATGLPPFKNSTHLTYDMDPFVVASFSKQIFKTNICRHALNPSWKNQFINIRVSKYSLNFQLKLSVYDFDLLAANDDICYVSVDIGEMIKESEFNADDLWSYKSLPLNFVGTSIMKSNKSINLSDYSPQLSIRFKYVSIKSLSALKHDFNPKKTKCPYCGKVDKTNSLAYQHLSICKLGLKPSQFLHKSYATSNNASRGWYVKLLAYIAYGRLTVGGNNAHILVQDRETGLVLEEKISAFVKLGIRLLYKSVKADNSSERTKRMLRIMSIKQGKRYDHPNSKSKIPGFVKFHGLDATLSECLETDLKKYNTFNEFFSRRLKPGARPVEGGADNQVIASVADSRLVVFNNVNDAKQLWIKGSGFTIQKLLGRALKSPNEERSVAIFRLAPQDYHRFHCPLNGKIIKISHIHGTYYTVNPMAIRSELDVFGENIRCIVSLETKEYGIVEVVLVGAMMVGSILLSVKKDDTVKKGQELGYFKFGGSTVILVFKNHQSSQEYKNIVWDADLIYNSNKKLETLVKVGMSVGHSVDSEAYKRHVKKNVTDTERIAIIRRVTGLGEGYGVGVGENIKSKFGSMIDDVISRTGSNKVSMFGTDRSVDDMVMNNWEINELTTIDNLHDDIEIIQSPIRYKVLNETNHIEVKSNSTDNLNK